MFRSWIWVQTKSRKVLEGICLMFSDISHRHDAQHRCCAIRRSRECSFLLHRGLMQPVCTHDSTLPLLSRLPIAKAAVCKVRRHQRGRAAKQHNVLWGKTYKV